VRAAELKKAPASDAEAIAQLAENAKVEAGKRRGGWVQVRDAAGASGWVRLLWLRYGAEGEAKQGDSGISQLFNVARTGSSGTQVTTGVRGLDAEQLANAQPNPQQLQKLETYAVREDAAKAFARKGKLESQSVDYPKGP
ncbi:MAG: SH3 domain-containing protein, partial [Burkholderiales bacterium]